MRRPAVHIAVVLLAVVIGGGFLLYREVSNGIHNRYAVWWVADMVVEHMEANDGRWPQRWEDLLDDYETCVARSGRPWTFEELRSRVVVDWQADPAQLTAVARQADAPSFRIIWLADGSSSHYQDHEPNQIVCDYLRTKKSAVRSAKIP